MGESAEHMAERNGISREAQDAFAVRSHHRAAQAATNGVFANEVASVKAPNGKSVDADTIVRGDTLSKIAQRYGVSSRTLRSRNGLNGDTIKVGQVIFIPARG